MILIALVSAALADEPGTLLQHSLTSAYVLAGVANVSVNGIVDQRAGWRPAASAGTTLLMAPYLGIRAEYGLTRSPVPPGVAELAENVGGLAEPGVVGQFHLGFVLDPADPGGPFFEMAMSLHPVLAGWAPALHESGGGPVIAAGYRWLSRPHGGAVIVEGGLRVEPIPAKAGGLAVPAVFYLTFGAALTLSEDEL